MQNFDIVEITIVFNTRSMVSRHLTYFVRIRLHNIWTIRITAVLKKGVIQGLDGTRGQKISISNASWGRPLSHNILRFQSDPTSYATRRVISGTPLSSFRILFDEPMLRNIKKCTVAEGQTKTGDSIGNVSLLDLDKFIGLVAVRGLLRARNLPVKSLWENSWGCPMLQQTMPRDRFLEVIRFCRVDLKMERQRTILHDKFVPSSCFSNQHARRLFKNVFLNHKHCLNFILSHYI